MKILLRLAPKQEGTYIDADPGLRLEKLLQDWTEKLPYRVFAARINNVAVPLSAAVRPDTREIVFLDMRDPDGKKVYQNSVLRLFIYAAKKTLPGCEISVSSSLNRGLFVLVKWTRPMTQEVVDLIEKEMRYLSKNPVPFRDIYYGEDMVVPSTAMVRNFDLKKFEEGVVIRIPEDTNPGGLAKYREDNLIYEALRQEAVWNEMLGVKTFSDLNQIIEEGGINELIHVSEALQEKNVAALADTIVKSGKRVVLIAGPSSSGKTTFAHRLCTQLWVNGRKPIYLGTDDYYINRDEIPFGPDGRQNFEDLDSIDIDLFNQNLSDLLAGKTVDIPRFDFGPGVKVFGERFETAVPGQPIVIEGIHGLNDALTPQIPPEEKFRIYISPFLQISIDELHRVPLTDVRKIRRIVRDAAKRNWSAKQTIDAWPSVRAGEDKNIFPYSDSADALFNSTQVFELAVLKKYAQPLLEAIGPEDEDYCEAQRLLDLLSNVDSLEDDRAVASNSILREFIGGSTVV